MKTFIPFDVNAANALAERVLGPVSGDIEFAPLEVKDSIECFVVENHNDGIRISGTTTSALCVGLNQYLRQVMNLPVSWREGVRKQPNELRPVVKKIEATTWTRYRYFFNFCTFGYYLPFACWNEWEPLIDWLALNGINLPLCIVGHEAIWSRIAVQFDLNASDLDAFISGAPYLPWWWMGGLDGWGGPLSEQWMLARIELGQKILMRMRALGMQPVLPGFSGHVPTALVEQHSGTQAQTVSWFDWQTQIVDPMDPLFSRVANAYYSEQTALFGEAMHYAADPFIEMVPPTGDVNYLKSVARAVCNGIQENHSSAKWVFQGWMFLFQRAYWTSERVQAWLDAVGHNEIIVLDLWCEMLPVWEETQGFYGKPWIWCNVQNFGGNVHLTAAFNANQEGLLACRERPSGKNLVGLGFANEAMCHSQVAYDFLLSRAWSNSIDDVDLWLMEWCRTRYGSKTAEAENAWIQLRPILLDVYQYEQNYLLLRPGRRLPSIPENEVGNLLVAWENLLSVADTLRDKDAYCFDCVHIGREALFRFGNLILEKLYSARDANDLEAFCRWADAVRQLIKDLEELLATRSEFLLGAWLRAARDIAPTKEDAERLEWGARRLITVWGDGHSVFDERQDPTCDPNDPLEPPHGNSLRDYARKAWAGMLTGYYLPRWEKYFLCVHAALEEQRTFDFIQFQRDLLQDERSWADSRERFAESPVGDSIEVASTLCERYMLLFQRFD